MTGVRFGAAEEERQGEIVSFLSEVFGIIERPPNLQDRMLRWKYFEPHPWWSSSRSYLLELPAGIAAHVCVAPVRLQASGQQIESGQFIDWAANRAVPGAGVLILRSLLRERKMVLLAIGGSDDAAKVFAGGGWFKRKADLRTYARPLRPWQRFLRSAKSARELARWGRNVDWHLRPSLPDPGRWVWRKARGAEPVFAGADQSFVSIERTREWFEYLSRCTTAQTECVVLELDGSPRGHAFLSNVLGSVRIADLVIASGLARGERAAAFSALVRYIAENPEAIEVTAASSLDQLCITFEDCGLRFRHSSTVYVVDPHKLMPAEIPVEIAPVMGDAYYMADPSYPFLC